MEGGRLAQATREGLGWDALRAPTRRPPPPPPRGPAAFLNCSRSGAWGPRSGPCLQRVGSQDSAFPRQGRKHWAREWENGKGAEGSGRERVQSGAPERVYRALHAQPAQKCIRELRVLVALGLLGVTLRVYTVEEERAAQWRPRPPGHLHPTKQTGDNWRAWWPEIVREEGGKGGGARRQASLAGKGAEKVKERRSTRKIYWADQMHRGG